MTWEDIKKLKKRHTELCNELERELGMYFDVDDATLSLTEIETLSASVVSLLDNLLDLGSKLYAEVPDFRSPLPGYYIARMEAMIEETEEHSLQDDIADDFFEKMKSIPPDEANEKINDFIESSEIRARAEHKRYFKQALEYRSIFSKMFPALYDSGSLINRLLQLEDDGQELQKKYAAETDRKIKKQLKRQLEENADSQKALMEMLGVTA